MHCIQDQDGDLSDGFEPNSKCKEYAKLGNRDTAAASQSLTLHSVPAGRTPLCYICRHQDVRARRVACSRKPPSEICGTNAVEDHPTFSCNNVPADS
jgi:hypothetical protein